VDGGLGAGRDHQGREGEAAVERPVEEPRADARAHPALGRLLVAPGQPAFLGQQVGENRADRGDDGVRVVRGVAEPVDLANEGTEPRIVDHPLFAAGPICRFARFAHQPHLRPA
jgi:hypothetical protein